LSEKKVFSKFKTLCSLKILLARISSILLLQTFDRFVRAFGKETIYWGPLTLARPFGGGATRYNF